MINVWDLLEWLLGLLQASVDFVGGYAVAHPVETALAGLALLRLCGTTVQTGSKGVLFVFGRVRKELEPGFHPLVPLVMTARKTPTRSITLDLPRQRLTTADGMVYDVQVNIVYRVADPKLALTHIDNLHDGIEALLPLIAEDLLRQRTRATILDSKEVETDLTARAEEKLRRWGVTVEHAGFKSIAPTKRTLRLTQLAALGAERRGVIEGFLAAGVSLNGALALVGADRRLVGHATARYRALHRHAHRAPEATQSGRSPLLPGEEPGAAPEQVPEADGQTFSSDRRVVVPAAQPVIPRTKKTTQGIQPRGWLRLRGRLRIPQAPTAPAAFTWAKQPAQGHPT